MFSDTSPVTYDENRKRQRKEREGTGRMEGRCYRESLNEFKKCAERA